VKYLKTWQSCENDFGQYFNLKKMKNLSRGFFKILQFPFLIKKKKPLDKILSKHDIVK